MAIVLAVLVECSTLCCLSHYCLTARSAAKLCLCLKTPSLFRNACEFCLCALTTVGYAPINLRPFERRWLSHGAPFPQTSPKPHLCKQGLKSSLSAPPLLQLVPFVALKPRVHNYGAGVSSSSPRSCQAAVVVAMCSSHL